MRTESETAGPSLENLQLIEQVADRIGPDDDTLAPWFAQYRREHTGRLATDLALIEQHVAPEARVLEYGAIPLLLTAALSSRRFNVVGLDVGPERFSRTLTSLHLDVRRCDVETEPVPFDDATFDVVLFNELFEHLRINPIFTLREAHRVLTAGGRLLLSTPNLRSFRGLRNLLLHNRGHAASPAGYAQYAKLESLGHMGHVREYTTLEVTEFLERVGFRVDTMIFRGGHGAGLVGVAERLLPRWRPSFSVIASRPAEGARS